MYGVSKEKLIKALESIRKYHCQYAQGMKMCDCKFGAEHVREPFLYEDCGCPELRQVAKMIETLTDYEYNAVCKNAGIML